MLYVWTFKPRLQTSNLDSRKSLCFVGSILWNTHLLISGLHSKISRFQLWTKSARERAEYYCNQSLQTEWWLKEEKMTAAGRKPCGTTNPKRMWDFILVGSQVFLCLYKTLKTKTTWNLSVEKTSVDRRYNPWLWHGLLCISWTRPAIKQYKKQIYIIDSS